MSIRRRTLSIELHLEFDHNRTDLDDIKDRFEKAINALPITGCDLSYVDDDLEDEDDGQPDPCEVAKEHDEMEM